MKVKTKIDSMYPEIEVHVCNREMNPQVKDVAERISKMLNDTVAGTDKNGVRFFMVSEIVRFYAQNQKVFAQNSEGIYSVQKKLYELEEQLAENGFFRASKSELVNLHKIRRLDMDMTGTIKIIFVDGTQTYTSRRNIPRLKKALGIGKETL
ncbi:MAG: LytTR family DNA-binding domain-containing protein [Lachnospiraceae bacterium]|nr:LytTR family DNA-binding domain-containing protein [Lachnospiraceae bacterium]